MFPARVLRLLATNYIFTEVSPDVFANNRLSSVLDTGKLVEELLEKLVPGLLIFNDELRTVSPESKHIGTLGITSMLEYKYVSLIDSRTVSDPDGVYSLDEGFKTSSYLTETLLDPEFGHSYESNKTAFNKAYNVKEDMWTWYEAPGNRLNLTRFGAAMNGVKNMAPVEALLEGSFRLRGSGIPPCHI